MKNETFWFRCPPELKARINALAKQEGRTPSNMIVRLLDSAIDSYEAMANINHRSLKVTNIPPLPEGAIGRQLIVTPKELQKRGQK